MIQNETKKKKPRTHPLYAVVLFLIKIVYTIIYRPHVHGKENIPDKNKAYIVCSNHISGNDVIFMAWSLGQQAHFVAKEELMKNPFIRFFANIFGVIPIKRGGADIGAIKKAIDAVKDGGVLGIFPQGTRRRGAKPEVSQFRSGIGMMAAHAEADVLPMYIKTKGYRIRPFRRVDIYFGELIKYEELGFKEKKFAEFNAASKYVAEKIVALDPGDDK